MITAAHETELLKSLRRLWERKPWRKDDEREIEK
jgi:hypothetical protein